MGVFVPLGIPDFNGGSSKGYISLKYTISGKPADKVELEVRKGGNTFFKVTITDSAMLRIGSHEYQWDGFDNNGILDTAFYTSNDFNFLSRIYVNGQVKFNTVKFKCAYEEVDWVDVKIDKNSKRIGVTLRVNLRDGGEKGTEKDCQEFGASRNAPILKKCPWDEISEAIIKKNDVPIKKRTKSYEDLNKMALNGIKKYWSRKLPDSKGISIEAETWEIIINAEQDDKGMKAPKIVYFTNSKETNFTRSHNWELSRKLFYKVGFLKYDDWFFQEERDAEIDFTETSAHEIGHEILLAYGGQLYSKKHKGTSSLGQSVTNENSYPKTGEIDLMKYYDGYYPYDFYERRIANEKDVISLVWLAKLKLK